MDAEYFRTGKTSLSDDELLILDAIFDKKVAPIMLQGADFAVFFNCRPHTLNDRCLADTLERFQREGVIAVCDDSFSSERIVQMTPDGGALWSAERCPDWSRYCIEEYRGQMSKNRVIMSVQAVSSDVRDDFVRLWPMYPARRKNAVISDRGLIPWRNFGTVYVGLALYYESDQTSSHSRLARNDHQLAHWKRIEPERTWWRCVSELQKFLPTERE
jgi:hypothetical protein